jgi:hypothetical protein
MTYYQFYHWLHILRSYSSHFQAFLFHFYTFAKIPFIHPSIHPFPNPTESFNIFDLVQLSSSPPISASCPSTIRLFGLLGSCASNAALMELPSKRKLAFVSMAIFRPSMTMKPSTHRSLIGVPYASCSLLQFIMISVLAKSIFGMPLFRVVNPNLSTSNCHMALNRREGFSVSPNLCMAINALQNFGLSIYMTTCYVLVSIRVPSTTAFLQT